MAPGLKRRLLGFAAGLVLLACACAPEATPLPPILPTRPLPTATPSADSTPAPLRYAVAPDALPYLSDADRALISAQAELIALDAPPAEDDLGVRYDIVVALGRLPAESTSPTDLQVSLLINTSLSPLDDPGLADALRLSVDPQALAKALGVPPEQAGAAPTLTSAALRVKLANAGYPDGFDVTLAGASLPGADALTQMLAAVGIEARPIAPSESAHLTLTTTPASADANALALYHLPIHFRAVDGLNITFTPSGWPLAQRSG